MCILTYLSKNKQFKRGPQQMLISIPMFLSGNIDRNQLQEMFGQLQRSSNLTSDGKLGMQRLMSNPIVLSTIQTLMVKTPNCGEFYAKKREIFGSAEIIELFTY